MVMQVVLPDRETRALFEVCGDEVNGDRPLNDEEFFEGVRIYPGHQAVGYINFPVPSHADVDSTAVLTIAPAIADGATAPAAAKVGPMTLPKL